jgi:anti-sigma B factor antagonist
MMLKRTRAIVLPSQGSVARFADLGLGIKASLTALLRVAEDHKVGLSITTSRHVDGTLEICPRGEIDIGTAHELSDAINTALVKLAPNVVRVNLWLVTFIDSVGIGTLVAAYRLAAASGVQFVVVNPTDTVYRQLWVSGLVGLFGSPQPIPNAVRPMQIDPITPVR